MEAPASGLEKRGKGPKMRNLPVVIDQEVLHGHLQQLGQSQQVVHRRQAFPMLPLIDGLGVLKAKVRLQIPHGELSGPAVPLDAAARFRQVDHRKSSMHRSSTILSFLIQAKKGKRRTGNRLFLYMICNGEARLIICIFFQIVNALFRGA